MPSNPVLKESTFQQEISDARQQWGAPAPSAFAGDRGAAPPYAAADYSVMTNGGTATATGVLLFLVLIFGVIGFNQVEITSVITRLGEQNTTAIPSWFFVTFIGGIGLGLLTSFMPKIARFTSPIYAILMGLSIGVISAVYEVQTKGVVLQAVMATIGVSLGMWFLFTTRIIKVTQRMRMIVTGATMGIMLMYLFGWIMSLFGSNVRFWNEPSALGIGISLVIVGVAAFNLLLDFDFVEKAVAAGAPKHMEWYGAFGITVTLVWLYLELLRLISLLNRR